VPDRPRPEDYTTCTAVAPDVVFAIRMFGTGLRTAHNAQVQLSGTVNLQVSASRYLPRSNRGPDQV
jgi:hypothetical protein